MFPPLLYVFLCQDVVIYRLHYIVFALINRMEKLQTPVVLTDFLLDHCDIDGGPCHSSVPRSLKLDLIKDFASLSRVKASSGSR